jgi:hypothetical protein
MAVSIIDRRIANVSASSKDLNCPDIFCFTLIFRIARSEPFMTYFGRLKKMLLILELSLNTLQSAWNFELGIWNLINAEFIQFSE